MLIDVLIVSTKGRFDGELSVTGTIDACIYYFFFNSVLVGNEDAL